MNVSAPEFENKVLTSFPNSVTESSMNEHANVIQDCVKGVSVSYLGYREPLQKTANRFQLVFCAKELGSGNVSDIYHVIYDRSKQKNQFIYPEGIFPIRK